MLDGYNHPPRHLLPRSGPGEPTRGPGSVNPPQGRADHWLVTTRARSWPADVIVVTSVMDTDEVTPDGVAWR